MITRDQIPATYKGGKLIHVWTYRNEAGEPIGYDARYDHADGRKDVIPFFGATAKPQASGKPKPLFGLETKRTRGDEHFIAEGAKCAAALHSLDMPCVTSQGGACSARDADWSPLEWVTKIIIIPDNDEAGEKYASDVAEILSKLPGKRRVRIARLRGLPEGGDIVDWIQARVPKWDGYGPVPREPGDGLLDDLYDEIDAVAEPVGVAQIESMQASGADPWPEPVPYSNDAAPAWPEINRPYELMAFCDAVSAATETPIEFSAAMGLAVLAAAVQRKFEIEVSPGYREPLSIFAAAVANVSERKTAVHSNMTEPIAAWERLQRDRVEPEIVRVESEIKTRVSAIEKLRRDAARKTGPDLDRACREIAELEAALPALPVCPRVWTSDSTPEVLASLLEQNHERIAVLSDEGGVLDALSGARYNNGRLNLDLLLQGHSGAPVRVDRVGRAPILLQNPALTLGLMVQPETLRALGGEAALRGRGLIARMLFVMPEGRVGRRKIETPPIPDEVREDYRQFVTMLLDIPVPDEPRVISLSDDALRVWRAFAAAIEADLAPGGRLRDVADWGGKLAGAVARIAGLMHVGYLMENADVYPIDEYTMRDAVRLGHVLTEHAMLAFEVMGASRGAERARRVLNGLTPGGVCSRRDVFRLLGNPRKSEVDEVIEDLVLRDYLRPAPAPVGTRGRPMTMFEVSPHLRGDPVDRPSMKGAGGACAACASDPLGEPIQVAS